MSNVRNVKTLTVIAVESVIGDGVENDPVRRITEYYTLDGELLATVDCWRGEKKDAPLVWPIYKV